MTPEQKAAYVMAQATCAVATIVGMQAENQAYPQNHPNRYTKDDFEKVMEQYCIGHNAVLSLFQGG